MKMPIKNECRYAPMCKHYGDMMCESDCGSFEQFIEPNKLAIEELRMLRMKTKLIQVSKGVSQAFISLADIEESIGKLKGE